MPKLFRQNDRRRYHRSGQGTPTGFIDPGNSADSNCPQFFFVPKTAAPIHAKQSSADCVRFHAEKDSCSFDSGKLSRHPSSSEASILKLQIAYWMAIGLL